MGIDVDIAVTALRLATVVLTAVALLCLARGGPGWLAGGFCVLLAGLAMKVNGATMTRLDTTVQHWLGAHRSHALQSDARIVFSYLGEPAHFAFLVVFFATLLSLHARSMRRGLAVVGAVGVGVLVEQSLKALIGRTAASLADYSHAFPSGHVTVWAVFLGMVAVCLGAGRSLATRSALAILALTGVLSVAFLAVYSGAHTVTDIVGGMVLGCALVALGAATLRVARPKVRVARTRPAVQLGGGRPTVQLSRTRPTVQLSRTRPAVQLSRTQPAVQLSRSAAMRAHTVPMRTEDILFGRGY